MMVPMEYARASEHFDRFMKDAQAALDFVTPHQTYQTVYAVLLVFRRRLDIADALAFADVLPAVLRAIFVADWDINEERRPFADQATLSKEVQGVRRHHNFSPDTAIRDIATVLRRHVDTIAFGRVLARLPAGAAIYWSAEEVSS